MAAFITRLFGAISARTFASKSLSLQDRKLSIKFQKREQEIISFSSQITFICSGQIMGHVPLFILSSNISTAIYQQLCYLYSNNMTKEIIFSLALNCKSLKNISIFNRILIEDCFSCCNLAKLIGHEIENKHVDGTVVSATDLKKGSRQRFILYVSFHQFQSITIETKKQCNVRQLLISSSIDILFI